MEFRLGAGLFYEGGQYFDVTTFNLGFSEFQCVKSHVGSDCDHKDGGKGKCSAVQSMSMFSLDLTKDQE